MCSRFHPPPCNKMGGSKYTNTVEFFMIVMLPAQNFNWGIVCNQNQRPVKIVLLKSILFFKSFFLNKSSAICTMFNDARYFSTHDSQRCSTMLHDAGCSTMRDALRCTMLHDARCSTMRDALRCAMLHDARCSAICVDTMRDTLH